jgi:hypothetical protein
LPAFRNAFIFLAGVSAGSLLMVLAIWPKTLADSRSS